MVLHSGMIGLRVRLRCSISVIYQLWFCAVHSWLPLRTEFATAANNSSASFESKRMMYRRPLDISLHNRSESLSPTLPFELQLFTSCVNMCESKSRLSWRLCSILVVWLTFFWKRDLYGRCNNLNKYHLMSFSSLLCLWHCFKDF